MPNAQPHIATIEFDNPRLNALGVEVLSLSHIRRSAAASLVQPQRLGFHLLFLVSHGSAAHTVDFRRFDLHPGSLIYARPGQVQQWHPNPSLDGTIMLVKPEALGAISGGRAELEKQALGAHLWSPCLALDEPQSARLESDWARLRTDIEAFTGDPTHASIIWHNLQAALLRGALLMRAQNPPANHSAAAIFTMFEQLLAEQGHQRLPVSAYAKRLGYSESTLNRVCLAMAAKTTKKIIDERTALEAKRLLVHSGASITEISHRLGFSEVTNFAKFFVRLTHTTPQRFRAMLSAPSPKPYEETRGV